MTAHYVYRLHDVAGECIYVGCSDDPERRMLSHAAKPWGPTIHRMTTFPFHSRADALAVEQRTIATLKPRYNRMHNPAHTGRKGGRPRGHRLSPPAFEYAANAAGLTITQLAERSDIPRATISGLLGGHHRASVKMVTQLSDALTCPPGVLFPTMLSVFAETAGAEAAA